MLIQYTSLAKEEIKGDRDVGNKVFVEEKALTNAQLENKLSSLQNKVDRGWERTVSLTSRLNKAEAKIARLETNQKTIRFSMRMKCTKIDEALDTGVEDTTSDCCQTGYYILCLSRGVTNYMDDFVKDPPGTCAACPTNLTPSEEKLLAGTHIA